MAAITLPTTKPTSVGPIDTFQDLDFLGLPHFVALKIFKKLDYFSIQKTRQVNRSFRDQTNDQDFWKHRLIKVYGYRIADQVINGKYKEAFKMEYYYRCINSIYVESLLTLDESGSCIVNYDVLDSLEPDRLGQVFYYSIKLEITPLIKVLVQNPDYFLNKIDVYLKSLFVMASMRGNIKLMELISNNPNFIEVKPINGCSITNALYYAAEQNQIEAVKFILSKFSNNIEDEAESLRIAAAKGYVEILRLLINCDKLFQNVPINNLWKIVINAFHSSNIEAVSILMKCNRYKEIQATIGNPFFD